MRTHDAESKKIIFAKTAEKLVKTGHNRQV